ncbi:hypothetical protein PI124_g10792 [Phytophthora idaei]|nr:hypothetical protein PI125_g8411 [Phytophthora idaei]KAG3156611.1 hypothetical protein PI126_g8692 [Phytophthora idaei]KAG3244450.1 hypothetical protein PI124_g10792 [Phytophthora idaei]
MLAHGFSDISHQLALFGERLLLLLELHAQSCLLCIQLHLVLVLLLQVLSRLSGHSFLLLLEPVELLDGELLHGLCLLSNLLDLLFRLRFRLEAARQRRLERARLTLLDDHIFHAHSR